VNDVSIRTAADEDVRTFVGDRDDRHYFLDHLAHKGGVLLFAFRGAALAGHVLLRIEPPEEPELRADLPGVPLLERLKVFRPHRGSGIGRRLVAEAERRLAALGHGRVALGVHPDNKKAIRLYRSLSFAVWREETLTTFREHVRDDGSTVREWEPCLVFVKSLQPPPPS
jgi:ribosomal protein S18 acetylase RimI-like enzyme